MPRKKTTNRSRAGRRSSRAASGASTLSLRALREMIDADPQNWRARLTLADRLLRRSRAQEAYEIISPAVAAETADIPPHGLALLHKVAAFAATLVENWPEARRCADALVAAYPKSLDGYYVLSYVNHHQGAHDKCLRHARQYLDLIADPAQISGPAELSTTRDRNFEIFNYIGTSSEELGQVNEALNAYEQSIEARRAYDHAWANLARLLARIGRTDDARAVLREGRKACPLSPTLTQLHIEDIPEPRRQGATISLCMIVKNEEEHLPRCLTSVRDLVDQIVVVDTGSTDRTVEIAESFGAEVYHHAWEGDFSKARNISMGYADCDWILIMDADEELETTDIPVIRHAVTEADFQVIAVSVYNYSARKEMYTSFLPSNRLVRRDAGAYYDGIVHNQLRIPNDDGSLRIPARIYHYGYGLAPEAMARKSARSLALLEKQLEDNPDHGFAHFNIAQLLRGQTTDDMPALMDRVIHHAERAVALCRPDDPKVQHIHVMALHQLVTAYLNKGDYDSAEKYAELALEHKPGYLDVILSLGHIYSLAGRIDEARAAYIDYLERQRSYNEHEETDQVILLHLKSRHNALYGLGLLALMESNPREAVDWFEQCIAEQDNYLDVHFRLAVALWGLDETARAQRELRRELELHPENGDAKEMLTRALTQTGETATLRGIFEAQAAGDPSGDTRVRLARLELDAGQHDAALEALAEIDPDDADYDLAVLLRGEALYGLGRWEEACNAFRVYRERHPDAEAVLNDIGNCHFQLQRFAEAEACYRAAIDTGSARTLVYRNFGLVLAEQGKIEDAVFAIGSYLELNPGDVDAVGFLGDLHFKTGIWSQAIACYERVLESDAARVGTLTRLGDCYFNLGTLNAALLAYETALKIDPENEGVWERLRGIRDFLSAQQNAQGATDKTPVPETEGAVS